MKMTLAKNFAEHAHPTADFAVRWVKRFPSYPSDGKISRRMVIKRSPKIGNRIKEYKEQYALIYRK